MTTQYLLGSPTRVQTQIQTVNRPNARSLVLAQDSLTCECRKTLNIAACTTAECICGGDLHCTSDVARYLLIRGTAREPSLNNRLAICSMNEVIRPLIVSPNSLVEFAGCMM